MSGWCKVLPVPSKLGKISAGQLDAYINDFYNDGNHSPTNQVFFIIENSKIEKLAEKVVYSFWEKYDDTHTVIRFATSWATKEQDVKELCRILEEI